MTEPIMKETEWRTGEYMDCGDTLVLSKPTILRSNAGWYVGTLCKTIKCANSNHKPGLIEPYGRMTDYMTYDQCIIYLNNM
jgi:hypothetical protein